MLNLNDRVVAIKTLRRRIRPLITVAVKPVEVGVRGTVVEVHSWPEFTLQLRYKIVWDGSGESYIYSETDHRIRKLSILELLAECADV